MKNFTYYLDTINSQIAELLKTNFFIRIMRSKLDNINQQYSLKILLDEKNKNLVKYS